MRYRRSTTSHRMHGSSAGHPCRPADAHGKSLTRKEARRGCEVRVNPISRRRATAPARLRPVALGRCLVTDGAARPRRPRVTRCRESGCPAHRDGRPARRQNHTRHLLPSASASQVGRRARCRLDDMREGKRARRSFLLSPETSAPTATAPPRRSARAPVVARPVVGGGERPRLVGTELLVEGDAGAAR
jgi:hypothetical protein